MVLGIDGLETKVWGMRDDVKARTDEEIGDGEDEDKGEDEEGDDQDEEESEDGSSHSLDEEDSDDGHSTRGSSPPHSRSPTPDSEPSPPPPYTTHAEQQHALHLAERLLARTLAAADAEGNSMAAEMGASAAHFLSFSPSDTDFLNSTDANSRPLACPATVPAPRMDPKAKHVTVDGKHRR
jgi:hypothetical protein